MDGGQQLGDDDPHRRRDDGQGDQDRDDLKGRGPVVAASAFLGTGGKPLAAAGRRGGVGTVRVVILVIVTEGAAFIGGGVFLSAVVTVDQPGPGAGCTLGGHGIPPKIYNLPYYTTWFPPFRQ